MDLVKHIAHHPSENSLAKRALEQLCVLGLNPSGHLGEHDRSLRGLCLLAALFPCALARMLERFLNCICLISLSGLGPMDLVKEI